jgi:methyltransferase (TIGR00027 family)
VPKPVSFLALLFIEIVLLPLTIAGWLLFIIQFLLAMRGRRISMTTYDPLFARWIFDQLGTREDTAARELLFALPGISKLAVGLAFGPTLWAIRTTGISMRLYDYPVHSSPTILEMLSHRTTFFDEALLRYLDDVEQVVILGAGWDTRAYGLLAGRNDVRVFEVDAAETQAQKRRSLEAAGIDTTDVGFVTAEFNAESWLDALSESSFDADKPTFILWEGVTYYLDAAAVDATLRTVATHLAQGSAIAFDYFSERVVAGHTSLPIRIGLLYVRALGEPWIFGISTTLSAAQRVDAYLADHGLALSEFAPLGKSEARTGPFGGLALAVNR